MKPNTVWPSISVEFHGDFTSFLSRMTRSSNPLTIQLTPSLIDPRITSAYLILGWISRDPLWSVGLNTSLAASNPRQMPRTKCTRACQSCAVLLRGILLMLAWNVGLNFGRPSQSHCICPPAQLSSVGARHPLEFYLIARLAQSSHSFLLNIKGLLGFKSSNLLVGEPR